MIDYQPQLRIRAECITVGTHCGEGLGLCGVGLWGSEKVCSNPSNTQILGNKAEASELGL